MQLRVVPMMYENTPSSTLARLNINRKLAPFKPRVIVFAPFVDLPRFVQLEHSADRKLEREALAIPVPAVEPLCHHLVAEAEEIKQLELDLFCRLMIE